MHQDDPLYNRLEDILYETDVVSAMRLADCVDWIASGVEQGYMREFLRMDPQSTVRFSTPEGTKSIAPFTLGNDGSGVVDIPVDIIQGIIAANEREWSDLLGGPTETDAPKDTVWDALSRFSDIFTEPTVLVGHLVLDHDFADYPLLTSASHDELLDRHFDLHNVKMEESTGQ